ncbi:MAG TPA: AAA family ATPase [Hyphomicrobiales bacterium]|nr:AAA family ATPase [Hyphomicrobiales bacterium]
MITAADSHRSLLEDILAAFTANEGVIKLTGPAGSGKSAMCGALFQALRAQGTEVVYFLAPPQSVEALQNGIVEQLQLDATRNFTRTLTHYLRSRAAPYRHLVLIVDDAHGMDEPTLMAVRMLCNIQSHDHGLVRVVLSGSPALDALLCLPVYRSLAQRIGQSFVLAPPPLS